MTFDEAFARMVKHEGGYVDHRADPGGETRYGISKRSYPHLDIKSLTLAQAREIYLRDFWDAAGCTAVPDGIKFDLFDTAVNSGCNRAVRLLQRACCAAEDGQLGPRTLQAINSMHPMTLVARYNAARLAFMAGLPNWPAFGRGWANRIASNILESKA